MKISVSPVRPHRRFMEHKTAGTGMDPTANWRHFMKGESTIDRYRSNIMGSLPRNGPEMAVKKGLVPTGTTKCTYKIGLDENARVVRNASNNSSKTLEPRTFPKNPTDYITPEAPTQASKRPF